MNEIASYIIKAVEGPDEITVNTTLGGAVVRDLGKAGVLETNPDIKAAIDAAEYEEYFGGKTRRYWLEMPLATAVRLWTYVEQRSEEFRGYAVHNTWSDAAQQLWKDIKWAIPETRAKLEEEQRKQWAEANRRMREGLPNGLLGGRPLFSEDE
jgi:hypothetical protein